MTDTTPPAPTSPAPTPADAHEADPNGGLRQLSVADGSLAYCHTPGQSPGVVFLTGYHSDMTGQKALCLEAWARRHGCAFTRFDYRGHGRSSGRFVDGTIGAWRDDALAILDQVADGPQILVGSSMGGWLAVLAAAARPDRVVGLVGIAAAPDFTEALIWPALTEAQRARLLAEGLLTQPSAYQDDPYPITRRLIEEGRNHLVLNGEIAVDCPVRLLHGGLDTDVPWQMGVRLLERLRSRDVRLTLIKDGGHRLSRPADLDAMVAVVAALRSDLTGEGASATVADQHR